MPHPIIMPQLSDTMNEGTLVKWLKKEGDKVKEGDIIAEVETDKATMEMESSAAGTLASLLLKEGDKAPVGAAIALLATGKETVEEVKKSGASAAGKPAASAAAPTGAAAKMPAPAAIKAPAMEPVRAAAPSAAVATAVAAQDTSESHTAQGRLKVSPLARRIAADQDVPLEKIAGTGPGGRIIQRDVLAYKGDNGAPAPAGQKQVVPLTKMRSAIAAQLLKSKQTIPHYYETIDVDLENLVALRQRMNQALENEPARLSLADFIVKAVASALQSHPALNARFDAGKNEVTRYGDVNLGMAVAIPDGLIVPILRGVNRLGLRDIRAKSADLIERARQQRLRREEQTEGTFTITNLGTLGVREFSAIINPPEVAILAVGAAQKRAVVYDGLIAARTTMSLTLSCDHRVVDGAVAAEFLRTLKHVLEEPGMMLL